MSDTTLAPAPDASPQGASADTSTQTATPDASTQTSSADNSTQSSSPDASAQAASSQPATASVTTVELKMRVFIPCQALTAMSFTGKRAFAGDGRDFSYTGGTSRAELVANITYSPGAVQTVSRGFGQSFEYNTSDVSAVPGKPDWFLALNPGAVAIGSDTLQASDDNLNIVLGAGASTTEAAFSVARPSTVVSISLIGALPLMTGAPAIDATLYVHIISDGGRLKGLVRGSHDGFPAYEIYLNQQLVYKFDPVAAGTSPMNLLPPEDIDVKGTEVDIGPA